MARKPPESHAKSKVAKAMHTERMMPHRSLEVQKMVRHLPLQSKVISKHYADMPQREDKREKTKRPNKGKNEGILDLTPDMEVKYRGGKWKPAGGGKKESNWAKWREKQGKGKKAA